MGLPKSTTLCVWSGCVWALIGCAVKYVADPAMGIQAAITSSTSSIVAAPLIGVLMGRFSPLFDELPVVARLLLACATLYAASFLFVLAPGLVALATSPLLAVDRLSLSRVLSGAAFGTFFGLIMTGAFVPLVPLAYANHLLIAKARNRERIRAH